MGVGCLWIGKARSIKRHLAPSTQSWLLPGSQKSKSTHCKQACSSSYPRVFSSLRGSHHEWCEGGCTWCLQIKQCLPYHRYLAPHSSHSQMPPGSPKRVYAQEQALFSGLQFWDVLGAIMSGLRGLLGVFGSSFVLSTDNLHSSPPLHSGPQAVHCIATRLVPVCPLAFLLPLSRLHLPSPVCGTCSPHCVTNCRHHQCHQLATKA